MKSFKIIDCWVSFILIPVFVIFGFITMSEKSFYGYFIVGGWQVVSMIVHHLSRWFTEKAEPRLFYHKLVLLLIIVTASLIALTQLTEIFIIPVIIIMFLLLIGSPIMAIYYAQMCYEETYVKMKRPMELLK